MEKYSLEIQREQYKNLYISLYTSWSKASYETCDQRGRDKKQQDMSEKGVSRANHKPSRSGEQFVENTIISVKNQDQRHVR